MILVGLLQGLVQLRHIHLQVRVHLLHYGLLVEGGSQIDVIVVGQLCHLALLVGAAPGRGKDSEEFSSPLHIDSVLVMGSQGLNHCHGELFIFKLVLPLLKDLTDVL
jgi:hypothetical protein